jgi:hypothetical protein
MKLKTLIIIAIPVFFIAFSAAIFYWATEIYKIYLDFTEPFSYYILILIIVSLLSVLLFIKTNLRAIINLIAGDRFFAIFGIILFLIALAMIFHQPVLLRPDKEIMAVESARDFHLRYFSDLGESFGGRAKFLFFSLHYLSSLIPLTIEILAVINSFLIVVQAILIFLVLKLLTSDGRVSLAGGLLFILYPINLLLGVSPEYAVLAQTFALGSILGLLLFLKYKDAKILISSLAILFLALVSRLEIVIFLAIYFFILFRALPADTIKRIWVIVILFFALILPAIFQILLGYASGSLTMAVHPILPQIFTGQETLISQKINFHYAPRQIAAASGNMVTDYIENIKNLLRFNFLYLFKFVPLFYFWILGLFFWRKNKHFQFFCVYFAAIFLFISLLAYKDRINAPQYLSCIIAPLAVLAGLFLKKVIDFMPRFVFASFVVVLLLLNFVHFQWAYQRMSGEGGNDDFINRWNDEYRFIQPFKKFINNDSVIIADQMSLWSGIVARNDVKVVRAQPSLVYQIKRLLASYQNVYVTQGLLRVRRGFNFRPDDWQRLIRESFRYRVIYQRDMEGNIPIFLYKIEGIKQDV